jgi:hypothetical protein
MSFLRQKTASTDTPTYTSVPIQTSVQSLPVPVGYGTFMLAGNLIWYGDFDKSNESSSGGKGAGGGKGGGTVDYTCSLMLALCEGGVSVLKVAKDGTSWEDLSQTGFGLIGGNVPQTAWSYLLAAYPAEALTYPGTAIIMCSHWDLGSSPQLPSQNVVLYGPLANSATWAASGEFQPADMGLIIQDYLTNPRYGVQDFPASAINLGTLLSSSAATTTGDRALQTYCRAMGFGFSPLISSTENGLSILKRWLQISNCDAVWSGSSLKFIPYGDTQVTANGVTYLPNVTPVYDFNDNDYICGPDDDPVIITRVDPTDVANIYPVEVTSNDGFYSSYPVQVMDQASIEAVGMRMGQTLTAHEIIGAPQGSVLAQLLLQRGLSIRNTYQFKLGWWRCLVEPMDIVTLTDARLGLSFTPVLITGIEEDADGLLTVDAEDFPIGIAGPTQYGTPGTVSHILNATSTAPAINPPLIFEPPPTMTTNGENEVWVYLSAPGSFWGGADVYVSTDNVNYSKVGTVTAPSRQGYSTTVGLPVFTGTNPDNADTLTVNLSESMGALISTTALNASLMQTLCYLDGELLSFTTATLTAPFTYALTGLYRGQAGTKATAHNVGSFFTRLDDTQLVYVVPPQYVGLTLWFKAVSFNIYGQGYEDISTVTAYTHTSTGNIAMGSIPFMAALMSGQNVALGPLSDPILDTFSLGSLSSPVYQTIVLGHL